MLAAVYHGPNDLRVEEVPMPEIGSDEVLLKVLNANICGTDLRIYHGHHRKFPPGTVRIPGHETAGTIVEVGKSVKGFQVGQRVFVAPNWGCGHCRQCVSGDNNLCANYGAIGISVDGAFAEYLRIPSAAIYQGNLIPVREDIDPAVGALIEPFACVVRGQNALHIRPGEVVLVMGAGPIGVMHTLYARLQGAGKILVSDLIPDRLEQVRQLGADRTIDLNREDQARIVSEESQGNGSDVVIVAAPAHSGQEAAVHLAAIGGRINFFGGLPKDKPAINLDSNLVHYKELIVTGTTACSTQDCHQAANIVNSGRIDLSPLISARFPLEAALQAFAEAENRHSLKVVIEP